MTRLLSLTMLGIAAVGLTLASPATSQAQSFGVNVGLGRTNISFSSGGYYPGYYPSYYPGYRHYHHHHHYAPPVRYYDPYPVAPIYSAPVVVSPSYYSVPAYPAPYVVYPRSGIVIR